MKPGRKPGQKADRPQAGTLNEKLNELAIGARYYAECELVDCIIFQRRVHRPAASRPLCMQHKKFKTEKYTAVSANGMGNIKYLVCVERTA